MKKGLFKSRKFKYGSAATAITIIFIALVVVVNIVVGLIIDRFPANLDLTSGNLYAIGDDSKKVLNDLKTDVKITVIGSEEQLSSASAYYKQVAEIIDQYQKNSNKVKLKYIDLDKNPDFANQYDEELASYDVIIESNLRHKILSINNDMLGYEYNGQKMSASDAQYYSMYYGYQIETVSYAEEEITSAIMYVSDENPAIVEFITAGDVTTDYYTTLKNEILDKNAYTVEDVNILTGELNSEAQIAILTLSSDLTAAEVSKLEAFLDNNGKSGKALVYIASEKEYDTPVLDEFLASWGIEVGSSYLKETNSNYYYQNEYNLYNKIVSFDYATDFDQSKVEYPVVFVHPVNQLFIEQGDITTTALITTNSTATLKTQEEFENELGASGEVVSNTASEKTGTYNTAVLSSKTNYSNNEAKSYVITFGTEYMFNDIAWSKSYVALNEGAHYTSYYLLSTFNTLTGKTGGITIVSKKFATEQMTLTAAQSSILGWTFVLVIPAAVVIIGIVIFVKRKNR